MRLWRIFTFFGVLAFLLLPNSRVLAALTFSDTLSTVIPNVASNHDLKWTVADSNGIADGESFTLSFPSEFNTRAITSDDVSISDNGSNLSIAGSCSGSAKVSFVNNSDGTFTFTICPGNGGAIASGHVVEVKIGTNTVGGSHQITNPQAGGYLICMNGANGYSDTDKTQVVILSGITTSAYFAGPTGNLRIIGYTSPNSLVFFLENGSVLGTQIANSGSVFDKTLSGLDPGIHFISIYSTDSGARNTLTISFGVNIVSGSTTIASGIILPPTVSLASSEVKRPAQLIASGSAKGNATVQIFISGSGDNKTINQPTDANGNWSANVNPKLHLGSKQTYALALDGLGGQSEFSSVSNYNVLLSADLNVDNLVNLTDFSILMYNYGTSNPPNVVADINDNGTVDLVDFSVMMYYWSGG
jgi:hypothetical protein